MYKFLHLAAPALAILLLLSGCETAERDLDTQIERSTEQDTNINTPAQEDINASDDNTTEGEQQESKIAYDINVSFSDNYTQKGYFTRGEVGNLSYTIINKYDNGLVNKSEIASITLRAEAGEEGKYFNFINFDGTKATTMVIDHNIEAADYVVLQANDLSGATNIIIDVAFTDAGKAHIIHKIPIVIEKNKSASMAIVPIDTRYENGLFVHKFVIHVVDSYGNKAKDGTHIYTGVINNPKLYSNALRDGVIITDNVLYDIMHNNNYTYFKDDKGTLDRENQQFTLPANSIDTTKDTITNLDTLIVLANKEQHKPYNLGGWDIRSVDSSDTISLVSLDQGENISNVSYVIGDEYRYDACAKTLMNAAASSFESTEVKDGIAFAELRYVPAMVGKTIFIYATSDLDNKRIGISRKVTLKGLGVSEGSLSCDYKITGDHCAIRYKMLLNGPDDTPAQNIYLEQPKIGGDYVYNYATASKTDCDGWTTINIYGIDENKTATVTFGGKGIYDELIVNQK